MARKSNPARLVIALSVAGVLAVFLLYTRIAGGVNAGADPGISPVTPKELSLAGLVLRPLRATRTPRASGSRLRDVKGTATWPPLQGPRARPLPAGRDIFVDGRFKDGVFVAVPGTMVTKCPSKYTPKKT